MKTFTIELPESFDIRRQDQIVTINIAAMPAHIIKELVLHGATQKVGDAAAGKAGSEAMAAMSTVAARLANGEWTGRAAGAAGEPAINRFIRQVMRAMPTIKANDTFKGLTGKDRDEWLMETFDKQRDAVKATITGHAEKAMAAAKAAEAAKAKLAGELDITI